MNKILHIGDHPKRIDWLLLVLRIGIALLMLVHGVPKMMSLFSTDPVAFPAVWGMSPALSLALAVFAEVACSLFLLIGLGTRLVVVPLIITMLVAVFSIHAADPFAKQELGLHYLLVYVGLLIAGSGRYSVDSLLNKKLYQPSFRTTTKLKRYAEPNVG